MSPAAPDGAPPRRAERYSQYTPSPSEAPIRRPSDPRRGWEPSLHPTQKYLLFSLPIRARFSPGFPTSGPGIQSPQETVSTPIEKSDIIAYFQKIPDL